MPSEKNIISLSHQCDGINFPHHINKVEKLSKTHIMMHNNNYNNSKQAYGSPLTLVLPSLQLRHHQLMVCREKLFLREMKKNYPHTAPHNTLTQ